MIETQRRGSTLLKYILISFVVLAAFSTTRVASQQQPPPPQRPASIKTRGFMDAGTMLSRIFPFYKEDSWLNMWRNAPDPRYSFLMPGLSNKSIVPTRESSNTIVPFKGWITREGVAKDGMVSLVLKIYDQCDGGKKLYEATHKVGVTHGQYFAIIQVPSETIAKSQTIWLEAAGVEEKELAFEPRQPFVPRPSGGMTAANLVTYVGLCYSCGGQMPYKSGEIPVPSGDPTEFGPQCSGLIPSVRTDYRPYLCVGIQF
jgi:hypothetical protein